MPKRSKKIDHPNQLSLFDLFRSIKNTTVPKTAPQAGSLAFGPRLKALLSEGLKQCPLSRWEVAAKMSELTGQEISKAMLDAWTGESKKNHRFPAEFLPAFTIATGYKEIQREQAQLADCYLIESEQALDMELGKIKRQKEELSQRERTIKKFLGELKKR